MSVEGPSPVSLQTSTSFFFFFDLYVLLAHVVACLHQSVLRTAALTAVVPGDRSAAMQASPLCLSLFFCGCSGGRTPRSQSTDFAPLPSSLFFLLPAGV